MNKLIFSLIAIAVCGFIAHVRAQGRGGEDSWRRQAVRYGWLLDYHEARALARKAGKPLMVVFRCVP